VQFYDSGWNWYGSKASLAADIAYATGIDESVLFRIGPDLQSSLAAIPVCRKMSWASNRQTERKEDIAYCLMGIFGVNMSLIYGEGTNAFIRLQKEIIESTNDLTILAWKSQGQQHLPWDNFGILAQSPREFSDSKDIILSQDLKYNPDFSVTNKGLRITVALPVTCGIEKPIMSLYCHRQDRPHESLGIYLGILGGEVYSRALPHVIPIEVEGKRSREASIFLSMDLERRNVTNSALVRGHHFSFRYTYPPEMIGAVRLLSSHPAKRWDESFGFRAKDTPTFVGITTYKAFWQGKASNFVIVCGFGPDAPPWASMDIEGSELWYAAEQRDFLRAGGLGRTQQTEHISLRTEMELNVEIRPFLADDGEPRWMQIEVRVDQRRKHPRTHHKTRPRRLVDYRDRALLLPEPDVT
jgi:hypothetical protein